MITPQEQYPKLAEVLGLKVPLYFKREDLHPFGSHKGRSIPYMIEQYARGGATKFAISSSGNAALAAGLYIQEYNKKFTESPLSLQIFVGENINPIKYRMLSRLVTPANTDKGEQGRISITQCEKPKQSVHVLNKKGEAKALRQSSDDLALIGYGSLIDELKEIGNIGAVFVPTSSGTTAQALAESGLPVYVVQTISCHPIAELFDPIKLPLQDNTSKHSIADAIVDQIALRKNKITSKLSGGFIVSEEEIEKSITLVRQYADIEISPNSALSVAALCKTLKQGWQPSSIVVCLITGH